MARCCHNASDGGGGGLTLSAGGFCPGPSRLQSQSSASANGGGRPTSQTAVSPPRRGPGNLSDLQALLRDLSTQVKALATAQEKMHDIVREMQSNATSDVRAPKNTSNEQNADPNKAQSSKGNSESSWPNNGTPNGQSEGSSGNVSKTRDSQNAQEEINIAPEMSAPELHCFFTETTKDPEEMSRLFSSSSAELAAPQKLGHRSRLRHFVHSKAFDITSSVVVAINTIIIAIQTDTAVGAYGEEKRRSATDEDLLGWLGFALLIYFVLELIIRMYADGTGFLAGPDLGWNLFDTLVIGFAVVDQALNVEKQGGLSSGNEADTSQWAIIRTFRLLRILRVVRILRIARGFRQLRLLIKGILGSFRALAWTALLLLLMMVVFAVIIVSILSDDLKNEHACEPGSDTGEVDEDVCEVHTAAKEHFPSVSRALFGLFGFMTDGWVEVTDVLVLTHPFEMWVFIVAFVTLTTIAVLNVVTGVFVDQTLAASRQDEENMIRAQLRQKDSFTNELRRFFKSADTDGNGDLSWAEFSKDLENPRVTAQLQGLEISVEEAKGLFKLIDVDNSGSVSIDEFVNGACRVKGQAKAVDVVQILYKQEKMLRKFMDFREHLESRMDTLADKVGDEFSRHRAFRISIEATVNDLLQKLG